MFAYISRKIFALSQQISDVVRAPFNQQKNTIAKMIWSLVTVYF